MKIQALLLLLAVAGGVTCWRTNLGAQETKLAATTGSTATVHRIELPVETAAYRPGPGVEQAQTLCITCHSAEYVATQPPMPRKFWEASVKKMKEKFGAPLPDDVTVLVDYLTSAYGTK
jgi:sulfite dehydrogenase (cytochrome) subunit B